jgi:hypothetical protein
LPRDRRLLGLLLAVLVGIAVLAVAVRQTEFATRVSIAVDLDEVTFTVNGVPIRAEVSVGHVGEIEVRASGSAYPMGGRQLVVRTADGVVLDAWLPARFSRAPGGFRPRADWCVDDLVAENVVFRHDVDLRPPYVVEAEFVGRCSKGTEIVLIDDSELRASFRRGLINNDAFLLRPGAGDLGSAGIDTPALASLRDTAHLLLSSLLVALLLIVAAAGGGALAGVVLPRRPEAAVLRGFVGRHTRVLGAILVVGATAIVLWAGVAVLERQVHTPDEVAYLQQAKWLLAGRLYQPTTPVQDHLDVPHTAVSEGRRLSAYPIGWPLVLAAGEAIGLPWLLGPLFAALGLVALFRLGSQLYGTGAALLACVLAALSPARVLISASFLSHALASLLIIVCVWQFLRGWQARSSVRMALSALALGYAFSMRPLTALAVAVPLGVVMLVDLVREGRSLARWRLVGVYLTAGLVGCLPVLLSNLLVTGSPLRFAYRVVFGHLLSFENLRQGIPVMDATIAYLLPNLFGWGWGLAEGWPLFALPLAFVFLPFVLGEFSRENLLLAAVPVAVIAGYTLHAASGIHGYGARFYAEAFFCLFLLAARGCQLLVSLPARLDRLPGLPAAFRVAAARGTGALVTTFVALLSLATLVTLPARLSLFRAYNSVDGSFAAAVQEQRITSGLIVLSRQGWGDWYPWGQAARLLPREPTAALAVAELRADNRSLLSFYAGRPIYRWEAGRLERVEAETIAILPP